MLLISLNGESFSDKQAKKYSSNQFLEVVVVAN